MDFSLPPDLIALRDRIRAFFLAYGRLGPNVEEELGVLGGMTDGLGPFTNSSNDQLLPIRGLRLYRRYQRSSCCLRFSGWHSRYRFSSRRED